MDQQRILLSTDRVYCVTSAEVSVRLRVIFFLKNILYTIIHRYVSYLLFVTLEMDKCILMVLYDMDWGVSDVYWNIGLNYKHVVL